MNNNSHLLLNGNNYEKNTKEIANNLNNNNNIIINNNHAHHHENHQINHNNNYNQKPYQNGTPGVSINGDIASNTTDKLSHEVINGQLALDQLLASLALESDVAEQHLANLDKCTSRMDQINGNSIDEGMSSVIATLNELGGSNWHSNRIQNSHDINGASGLIVNHTLRRVTEASSECSSSISPSLSERSNGVSWSDQVKQVCFCLHDFFFAI